MSYERRRRRILTWHVHGNYLYNLSQIPHELYLVTDPARSTHHTGRSGTLPWGDNVHEAPLDALDRMQFDLVIFQSKTEWAMERHRVLNAAQRKLPTIYLEHDPPQQHPTNTAHWADDPNVVLVHVTPFNALMWDNGRCSVRVIEHGVKMLDAARYRGELERGVVVVNNLDQRGRRLGMDLYRQAAQTVPLELVGMGSQRIGGAGEVAQQQLPAFMAAHRFFFHPVRYTSLGLAVIEAMMVGLPIVGLATTELATVIRNGENGFSDTRMPALIDAMRALLADPPLARHVGEAGRNTAMERFGIARFVDDWDRLIREMTA